MSWQRNELSHGVDHRRHAGGQYFTKLTGHHGSSSFGPLPRQNLPFHHHEQQYLQHDSRIATNYQGSLNHTEHYNRYSSGSGSLHCSYSPSTHRAYEFGAKSSSDFSYSSKGHFSYNKRKHHHHHHHFNGSRPNSSFQPSLAQRPNSYSSSSGSTHNCDRVTANSRSHSWRYRNSYKWCQNRNVSSGKPENRASVSEDVKKVCENHSDFKNEKCSKDTKPVLSPKSPAGVEKSISNLIKSLFPDKEENSSSECESPLAKHKKKSQDCASHVGEAKSPFSLDKKSRVVISPASKKNTEVHNPLLDCVSKSERLKTVSGLQKQSKSNSTENGALPVQQRKLTSSSPRNLDNDHSKRQDSSQKISMGNILQVKSSLLNQKTKHIKEKLPESSGSDGVKIAVCVQNAGKSAEHAVPSDCCESKTYIGDILECSLSQQQPLSTAKEGNVSDGTAVLPNAEKHSEGNGGRVTGDGLTVKTLEEPCAVIRDISTTFSAEPSSCSPVTALDSKPSKSLESQKNKVLHIISKPLLRSRLKSRLSRRNVDIKLRPKLKTENKYSRYKSVLKNATRKRVLMSKCRSRLEGLHQKAKVAHIATTGVVNGLTPGEKKKVVRKSDAVAVCSARKRKLECINSAVTAYMLNVQKARKTVTTLQSSYNRMRKSLLKTATQIKKKRKKPFRGGRYKLGVAKTWKRKNKVKPSCVPCNKNNEQLQSEDGPSSSSTVSKSKACSSGAQSGDRRNGYVLHVIVPTSVKSVNSHTGSSSELDDTHPAEFKNSEKLENSDRTITTPCGTKLPPKRSSGTLAGGIAKKSVVKRKSDAISLPVQVTSPGLIASSKAPVSKKSVSKCSPLVTGEEDPQVTCMCSVIPEIDFKSRSTSLSMLCQAVDTVDDELVPCKNHVKWPTLYRPSAKVARKYMCESHAWRMKHHHCCPHCGIFCSQGSFLSCHEENSGDRQLELHLFHYKCLRGLLCPHCGLASTFEPVSLAMSKSSFTEESCVVTALESYLKSEARINGAFDTASSGEKSSSLSSCRPENEVEVISSSLTSSQNIKLSGKQFYAYLKTGDTENVLKYLVNGANPNMLFRTSKNNTPLHIVAANGFAHIAHILIQAGSCLDSINNNLMSPLMLATEKKHVPVVEYLVIAGADSSLKDEKGMTAIHFGARSGSQKIMELLFSSGDPDINVKDDGGWTPLMYACEHRHFDVVELLLAKGADPNLKDKEENTALHWAVFSGDVAIAELLLETGCDVNALNRARDSPLHVATRKGHVGCVQLLATSGANFTSHNKEGLTPLMCCGATESWDYLQKYESLFRDQKEKSEKGFTRKVLVRDIARGLEALPISVVNDIDDEEFTENFHYITKLCESEYISINKIVKSMSSCSCQDNCSTSSCSCSALSLKLWYGKDSCLIPDFNMESPPVIFECTKMCWCSKLCLNRVIQKGIKCHLQLFRTECKGWGLRTICDIPRGTFICEYVGELITSAEADARDDDSYLFDLDISGDGSGYCIDAKAYGNVSRFLNHSCDPNLVAVKAFTDHQDLDFPHIAFFSNRNVKAYEELCFDYGISFWSVKCQKLLCACRSPKCKYSHKTLDETLREHFCQPKEETPES